MSYLIESPKRKYQNSRFGNLLDSIAATPFEFEVDQPLDDCAACLKSKERLSFLDRLFVRTTKVEIMPDGATTYRFRIRAKRGRNMPVIATGTMTGISDESTAIMGAVRTDRIMVMFTVCGLFSLGWIILAVQMTLFLLILPFLFSLVVLANLYFYAFERSHFVDFLKDTLRYRPLAYSAQQGK